jgi:hypothetical protein
MSLAGLWCCPKILTNIKVFAVAGHSVLCQAGGEAGLFLLLKL